MRRTCRLTVLRPGFVAGAMLLVVAPDTGAADAETWVLGLTSIAVPASRRTDSQDESGKPVPGVGAWLSFRATRVLGLEAEVDGYFPPEELGLLGATPRRKLLAVAGVRLDDRIGVLGVAARIRAGALWSDHDLVTFPPASSRECDFAIDLGGALEYRLTGRWLVRIDVSDLLIPSDDRGSHPFGEHSLRLGLGVGFAIP